jgi:hypothetical protein
VPQFALNGARQGAKARPDAEQLGHFEGGHVLEEGI